ncbi:MAG TPA: VWA domain-containing protein [Acidisarcina sp.]
MIVLPVAATTQSAPSTSSETRSSTVPAPTLSVEARLVTLPVTVRDKKGQLVTTLSKDDFTLKEDARAETVKFFSLDKDLPLTLGLLVDTSGSMRNALEQERTASRSFFEQMLTLPGDKAFLLHFDREVELLQDLTSSKDKLGAALQILGPGEENTSSGSGDPDVNDVRRHGGGTQLYDAVFLAADELLKKQPGRKAIVLLSDGGDRGSKETLDGAIEAAQRAEVSVYTIYFKGEGGAPRDHDLGRQGGRSGGGWPGGAGGGGWPGSGGSGHGGSAGGQRGPEQPHVDGRKIMQQIADETGGRLFEAKKKESIADIYKSIAEELRTQYVLAYTPDKDSSPSGFHKIDLTVDKKDDYVQTRAGYYADR